MSTGPEAASELDREHLIGLAQAVVRYLSHAQGSVELRETTSEGAHLPGTVVALVDVPLAAVWPGSDFGFQITLGSLRQLVDQLQDALDADAYRPSEQRGERLARIAELNGLPVEVAREFSKDLVRGRNARSH